MNAGKYVFSQPILHLPARLSDRCVERYDGNKYVKHFTCRSHLLCMMFGQLSGSGGHRITIQVQLENRTIRTRVQR